METTPPRLPSCSWGSHRHDFFPDRPSITALCLLHGSWTPWHLPTGPLSPGWPLSENILLEEGCPATHLEASPWGALQHAGWSRCTSGPMPVSGSPPSTALWPTATAGWTQLPRAQMLPHTVQKQGWAQGSWLRAPQAARSSEGAAHCLAPAVLTSEACAGWRSSWRGRSFSPHLAEFPVGMH